MNKITLPNIYKVSATFFIISCILLSLYLASEIIAPLIISLLFAILLRPAINFLSVKFRFPNILAVSIVVVLAILIMLMLIGFFGFQLTSFTDDLPAIKEQLTRHYHSLQNWIENTFGFSYNEQNQFLEQSISAIDFVSLSVISSITNSFMYVVIVPIYTFLILIYRSLLLNFIVKLSPDHKVVNIEQILTNLKSVVRSYIVGLLIQVVCISTMTGFGYYLIGIEHYIFLGILTGFLNLIPYIGILTAGVISCMVALVTSDDMSIILWVLGVNTVVQLIDNNFIVPKIVGSKVSINALASMVSVIIGGTIAGIAGMFLAIPILAMLKVIFESTKGLEPFGYLIGDEVPETFNWKKIKYIYARKNRLKNQDNPITKNSKEAEPNPEDNNEKQQNS
ncbi:MAG: AI-2E family transporter [Flavobacteriaceae bacterium]|nr:AI-2E family transporter [Flavobacteriaceae bacterium]